MIARIQNSKKLLIIPDRRIDLDLMAATVTLARSLKKSGKEVQILIDDTNYPNFISRLVTPEDLCFLEPKKSKNILITLRDQKDVKVKDVRWEQTEGNIKIVISTDQGEIKKENTDVKTIQEEVDQILLVGFHKFERIGEYYLTNKDLFTKDKVSYINFSKWIKDKNDNGFTQKDASSLSEIVQGLVFQLGRSLDIKASTDLLTGIYWKTEGFQNYVNSSSLFNNALKLIKLGGDLEKAVSTSRNNLKLIESRLVSEVLRNVKITKEKIALSVVRRDRAANVKIDEILFRNWNLAGFLDDIKVSYVILEQNNDEYVVFIKSNVKEINASRIARKYGGFGNNRYGKFAIKKELEELTSELILESAILIDKERGEETNLIQQEISKDRKKPKKEQRTKSKIANRIRDNKVTKKKKKLISKPQMSGYNEEPQKLETKKSDQKNISSLDDPLEPALNMPEPINLGASEPPKPKIQTPLPPADNN